MALKRSKTKETKGRIDILGVGVDDINLKEATEKILELSRLSDSSHYVVTVNPEFVMMARKNKEFAQILAKSDLSLPDGIGVAISKLINGGKVNERVTGVELIEVLCKYAAKKAVKVGFLGGFGSVAEVVAKRQKAANPGLKVKFASAGDPTISQDLRLNSQISAVGRIDILFVAYGMGQQEFWIKRHKNALNVGVLIGVGGAFDYLAGVKRRAPVWVQKAGFEWFWRLISQPYRVWRMRVLPMFLALVLWKFFTVKIKPI